MDNGVEKADLQLAQRLSALRQQQNWSLETLAQQTGISRATLSRVERAETSPTAALLNKLCAAYGLTMSRLLIELEEDIPQYLPREQQPLWVDHSQGFERRTLSPPAALYKAELIECTLASGAEIHYQLPPVIGLEHHLWMIEGELILTLDNQRYVLTPGDCLRYRLFGSSHFAVPGADAARYCLVICRP